MDTAVNRDLFLEKLVALIASKREDNCFYSSQEKYSKILSEVVSDKIKCNTPLNYRRLKRFDVLKINDEEKLIVPLKPGETNIQYYVTNEELYSILYETHTRIGHGGRTCMLKEFQVKYKNITYEVVMLYLNLWKHCQMKRSARKKGIVVKQMVSSQLNSKCQVDLIDLQSNRNGEYKSECKIQIDGIKNPKFKKFHTLSEAKEFVKFWEDKLPSPNKLICDEKLYPSSSASDVFNLQRGYCKASNIERAQAGDLNYCKKNTEHESLNVRSLQEKITTCEKKIDVYTNELNNILSGFKDIKNEFGKINDILKNFSRSQKGKLSKIPYSEPECSKEKSGFNSQDDGLCKDTSDSFNDNISQGIMVEDFDFSEFDECQTPAKRKRLSPDRDTDKEESSKKNKVTGRKNDTDFVPFIKDGDDYVAVYTDGCCLSNGYSTAKAGIGIWFGDNHPLNVSEPFRGVKPSNNNAEIQAARIAIEIALKANISKLKIITDSQFLINSAQKWIPKWKLNDWIGSGNKSIVNRVELEKLDEVMSLLSVRWEKVSGHSGIRGNEAADMLANKGAHLYVKM